MAELDIQQVENTLIISKVFDAPQALVFSMFKDPEQLTKWWGPTDWPATIVQYDFQPGGIWHYYMTGPDGTKAWGKATLKDIDEPNSLTFIDAFSDEEGNVNEELPQGIMTFTFEEQDGKTLLRMTGEYQSAEEAAEIIRMGMAEGMKDTWNQLETLIEAAR